jgi:hypothetical protein
VTPNVPRLTHVFAVVTLSATPSTRQAPGLTAAEPPKLHIRSPNLSLHDLLRFVIKPLQVAFGRLIGCLRRFYRDLCTVYLLLPAAKVGCLVSMLSCPESLGRVAFLLTRAQSFLHGRIHLRLQVAHARRNGTRHGQCKGCEASEAGDTVEQYNARAAQGTMLNPPGRAEERSPPRSCFWPPTTLPTSPAPCCSWTAA